MFSPEIFLVACTGAVTWCSDGSRFHRVRKGVSHDTWTNAGRVRGVRETQVGHVNRESVRFEKNGPTRDGPKGDGTGGDGCRGRVEHPESNSQRTFSGRDWRGGITVGVGTRVSETSREDRRKTERH